MCQKALALHFWNTAEALAGCINTVRFYLDKLTGWEPLHRSLNFIWMLMLALCWLYNAEFSHSLYQFNDHTNSLHYRCGLTIQNPPLQEITCISTLATNEIWQVNILLWWDLESGLWMPDDTVSLVSSHEALSGHPLCKATKRITEECEILIHIGSQKLLQLEKDIWNVYIFSRLKVGKS